MQEAHRAPGAPRPGRGRLPRGRGLCARPRAPLDHGPSARAPAAAPRADGERARAQRRDLQPRAAPRARRPRGRRGGAAAAHVRDRVRLRVDPAALCGARLGRGGHARRDVRVRGRAPRWLAPCRARPVRHQAALPRLERGRTRGLCVGAQVPGRAGPARGGVQGGAPLDERGRVRALLCAHLAAPHLRARRAAAAAADGRRGASARPAQGRDRQAPHVRRRLRAAALGRARLCDRVRADG